MGDVVMVALIMAFFGLAVLLVRACDSIIGPDPATPDGPDADASAGVEVGSGSGSRRESVAAP